LPTVESLVQSDSGMRQLDLLIMLTEMPADRDNQVNIEEMERDPLLKGLTESELEGDLELLKEWGWVDFWPSLGGIGSVVLKQPGLDAARNFTALRTDPRRRVLECRDAVLKWLYDGHLLNETPQGISDFLYCRGCQYLGAQYSQEELFRAAQWLMDKGYIKGHKAMGGEVLRPSITSDGTSVVETGQSVNAVLKQAGMTVNEVNISGSQGVNVSVASSQVNQSNTMTHGQIEQVERILASVRAMLTPAVIGVTAEVADQAQAIVGEVEEEIQASSPNSGKVKGLLLKLAELAGTGTIQATVDALSALMQQGIAGM
jgi:hypothetical protein